MLQIIFLTSLFLTTSESSNLTIETPLVPFKILIASLIPGNTFG
jgi:hypothetical protein